MKVAVVKTGPGVTWPTATESSNWFDVSHLILRSIDLNGPDLLTVPLECPIRLEQFIRDNPKSPNLSSAYSSLLMTLAESNRKKAQHAAFILPPRYLDPLRATVRPQRSWGGIAAASYH